MTVHIPDYCTYDIPDYCTYDRCSRLQWAGTPWCEDHERLMRALGQQAQRDQADAMSQT